MGDMRFDVRKARMELKELEEIREEMNSAVCRPYKESVMGLSRAWKGESAACFMGKADQMNTKLMNVLRDLKNTEEAYERAIANVVRAEERARQLAMERRWK